MPVNYNRKKNSSVLKVPMNRLRNSTVSITNTTLYWVSETICSVTTGEDSQYSLLHIPNNPQTHLLVFNNGILQRYNIDYTVSGNVLTFNNIVEIGRNIIAFYSYE
jgi:hypothetical protein